MIYSQRKDFALVMAPPQQRQKVIEEAVRVNQGLMPGEQEEGYFHGDAAAVAAAEARASKPLCEMISVDSPFYIYFLLPS